MKKSPLKKINVLVLLYSVILWGLQSLSANFASASVGAAVFLPNNFQLGYDTLDEIYLAEDVHYYIHSVLDDVYPNNV